MRYGIIATKLLAVAICGAGLMVLPAGAQELIKNGNFDFPTATPSTVIPFWTTFNQPGGTGAFYVVSGTAPPPGTSAATVGPKSPPNYAGSFQGGPGAHALLQTFTVPSSSGKIVLSFDMFVNDYNNGCPSANPVLDFTVNPNECARVDLLTATAAPLSTAPADVIRNFYSGNDLPLAANPHPYTHYSFDITANVVPGGTYQIRFAEADNQSFFNLGVDNVSILVTPDTTVYQLRYLANLDKGDSYINLTNAGTLDGRAPAGNICVNVYTFDPAEELISCCACPITPNGLVSLSARNDLISNTLTPGVPTSVTVKLVSSAVFDPNGVNISATSCNASGPGTGVIGAPGPPPVPNTGNIITRGMRAWATTLHLNTSGSPAVGYQKTETPFSGAELSATELTKLQQFCGFIQANGSGFGICKACRFGALGGEQK
ncbi:MAG: hypothetical protein M3Y27_10805 [Acidobacteriota bacterium]|nr:hypothetical protein [Acidobacteriota bacterium]